MARKRKLIDKKTTKRIQGSCHFCGVDDYCQLDVHRIIAGKDGGEYTRGNTVIVCVSCHRRIHDGQIVLDRKYFTTKGVYILRYWEEGEEKWK